MWQVVILLLISSANSVFHADVVRYDTSKTVPIEPGFYMFESELRFITYPPSIARSVNNGLVQGCCVGTAAGTLTCGAACPFFPTIMGYSVGLSIVSFFLEKNRLQMGLNGIVIWQVEAVENETNAFTIRAVSPRVCEDATYLTGDTELEKVFKFHEYYAKPMIAHPSKTYGDQALYIRTLDNTAWLNAGPSYAELSPSSKSPWTFIRLAENQFSTTT